eukprot:9498399-Pyramimonas_sp.AAC.1
MSPKRGSGVDVIAESQSVNDVKGIGQIDSSKAEGRQMLGYHLSDHLDDQLGGAAGRTGPVGRFPILAGDFATPVGDSIATAGRFPVRFPIFRIDGHRLETRPKHPTKFKSPTDQT